MTMDSFLDDGAAGLTFEQYDKLIKEHNNGRSVLTDNDLSLLELLVKRSDCITYSDDGRFSIDNDNFRKIADYIKSVPDEIVNQCEKYYGVRFPDSYRDFVKEIGGGYIGFLLIYSLAIAKAERKHPVR